MTPPALTASPPVSLHTVIAARGHRLELETPDGRRVPARTKGKRLRVVCGDRVEAEPLAGEADWLITAIGERRNALARIDSRGRAETLAANVDQLAVTIAVLPEPDFFIVDRYLCAAELMGIDAAVLYNKIDLRDATEAEPAALSEYEALGYPVLRLSAECGIGLDALKRRLAGGISMLVGQSGVGKSSLINAIVPDADRRIAEVSLARREGRHTTVAAEMLVLPAGGRLIDSPGVRDFAPHIPDDADVDQGFREIRETSARCRFNDCRHRSEPDCAVQAAVAAGAISERRYASYRRLLNLTRQLRRDYE
jgi:ribosome biogenesis GTPase